jgi:N-acetyl-anhydromuramyl-L-alanine amidase AmpD
MKKYSIFLFLFFSIHFINAQHVPVNSFQSIFKTAYLNYPDIPKGILEAVSYGQTRFSNIQNDSIASCTGVPDVYGPMGLTLDGKNYFRNNLLTVASLSGVSIYKITSDPKENILAYAKAYHVLKAEKNISDKIEDQVPILMALSELPISKNLNSDFALSSQLYQIYWFLQQSSFQEAYDFPMYTPDMKYIFGDNFLILSSPSIRISENEIQNQNGQQYKTNEGISVLSSDYAPALWNPAASCNYSTFRGAAISAITIHDVEGTYAGCISWFQNCAAGVSAHYVVRSSDGQVTQMVLEAYKAWHVGTENPYTIGIEHEGYQATGYNWYTPAMLNSSAALCADICNSGYGINPLRTYHGPSCSGLCTLGACVKIKGHQHYPNNTHIDPGPYWNWYTFYNLINANSPVNTITGNSGTLYDSGGPSNNYSDDERRLDLIQPPGATAITLNFTQFDLENNWDYMYIYDGSTVNAPLIGRYTGTVSPGFLSSTGGSILLDFRSDCATTNPGWTINYNSNAVPPPPNDNIAPVTSVNSANAWKTQNFSASFTDTDNSGGSGVQKGYYQVIDYDGTEWRANAGNGFFADNFDLAIHPDWTTKTGTWSINAQALHQSDENLTNTNIYAALTQNLSNRYLYHFNMKIDGSQTNRRAGFHFFCDNADSTNRNNSYFVWFRVDNSKLQIYKVVNDVFGSPVLDVPMTVAAGQWYDYKVIYDRIAGKMWVYQDNSLVGTYTDPSPYSNGAFISFRTGNASMDVNELKVYRSRSATANISLSNTMDDIRFQNPNPSTYSAKVKSICQDSADNISSIYYHDLNVDWTSPLNIDSVRDGLTTDLSITNSLTTLSANWDNSFDPNSGIQSYFYCIGTTPGDSNVVAFTSNMGANAVTHTGLNLTQGQMYYFTVRALNGAGLASIKTSSNGVLVDTTASTGISDFSMQHFQCYPNPATNEIFINCNAKVLITILDLNGKIVTEMTSDSRNFKMNIEALNQGVYLLKAIDESGNLFTNKFLKE